ncbi:diacylglycerol kinase family protein [Sphingomicrobium astaxanthinifaciens]|uniref:diacylglycerol kinase n=1 Tax=Sphingomicrobium astaxanthinifaciens TaxID=1227949 RepID=UPI001FCADE3F|nr:diacylglycerol kinase family protein [Sphingomicrobium astaxanthinifaciens]MCJ7420463.1 diacylglycerol kinase family protein [Sphingomicrobium astaxanthinifaciens]
MRGRLKAFTFALAGLRTLWREEPTTRFHAVGSVAALVAALAVGLERWEWFATLTLIAFIWFAEAVNTAVERLADAVTLEHHPLIGKAKDVASAAVVIASLAALAGVVIVFGPHVAAFLGA